MEKPHGEGALKSKQKRIILCRSQKRCEKQRAKYLWERIAQEIGADPDGETMTSGNLTIEKSPCQGFCEKAPNLQVIDVETGEKTQFVNLTPIDAAKIVKHLLRGGSEKGIFNNRTG